MQALTPTLSQGEREFKALRSPQTPACPLSLWEREFDTPSRPASFIFFPLSLWERARVRAP